MKKQGGFLQALIGALTPPVDPQTGFQQPGVNIPGLGIFPSPTYGTPSFGVPDESHPYERFKNWAYKLHGWER